MPRKPSVLLLSYFIAGSIAQAQSGMVTPPPSVDQGITPQSMDVGTPEQMGDADPLDVLEPKKEADPVQPTVPEFTEIPDPTIETPAPEVTPPTEVAQPKSEPEIPVEKPVKKNKRSKKAEPVVINNDPDLRREARFHRIYKKYNEQPTSEEAWEKASGARKAETYKVQKGDTLWDLSNTLFADANYWPKIWSLNVGNIGNPHEIDPKMSIQFFPGTMSDAPTLGLVEKTAEEMAAAPQIASNGMTPVPPAKKKSPVLKNIPNSIPNYVYRSVLPSQTSVDVPSMQRRFPTPTEYMTYYVANRSPDSLGTVTETELGMSTATDYQYVFLKLNSPPPAGQMFVAVKELDKVKDPDSLFRSANLIEVQGELEVIEKVHNSRDIYRAIVKKSVAPVNVGARLIAGPMPSFDPAPTSLSNGVHAQIIGGEFENKRQQYQSNMIVFINAGSAQGVREGQSFPVFSSVRNRNPDTDARINDRRTGTIKVIRVSDSFSTAYVTGAQDDIFVGDHVGARNEGQVANGWAIDGNTDIDVSPKSDLVPPVQEEETDSSDFQL